MIVALRYVDKEDGCWEVQTEKSIEQHTSLRHFQEQTETAALATRALQTPGVWVNVENGSKHETGE